ncbi:MAG: hypothetical protein WD317_04380 [Balneolaceae bacterium]
MNLSEKNTTPAVLIGEPGLVHCMSRHGIPVYTVSESSPSISSHSRYSDSHLTVSSYDSEEFIDELCALGQRLADDTVGKKAVLMSHDDRVLLNISNHRDRLEKYFLFRLPPADRVRSLLDKLKFCRLCEKYNLPAPVSVEVSGVDDLEKAGKAITPPYLIKPGYRHYWYAPDFTDIVGSYQKAYVCSTTGELEALYAKISRVHPDVVVQEYVAGDDDQMLDVNLHVTADGNIDGYVICRKLRVYPKVAGWTCYARTVLDESVYRTCREIIGELGLTGLLNLQFKRDEFSGEPRLIEIHTRTSILDYQGAAAGQNLPLKYYLDLAGGIGDPEALPAGQPSLQERAEPAEYPLPEQAGESEGRRETAPLSASPPYLPDVGYIHLARDIRHFARYRKNSGYTFGEWLASYRNVRVFDSMKVRDPKVLVKMLLSLIGG